MATNKYKLVFLGEHSVGKSSLIARFLNDSFEDAYQATIGIDFESKIVYLEDRTVRLQLWDTAGQERFKSLIPFYIRDSSAAVVVYDVTNAGSLAEAERWVTEVREMRGEDMLVFLVGNKIDLEDQRAVSTDEGQKKADELKATFIETSAKTASNVKQLFKNIAQALPNDQQKEVKTVDLQKTQTEESNCAC